jgi:seryl-tRNA synthetase
MLDIALIREKPDWVKEQIRKVQDEPALLRIDRIIELDTARRQRIRELEELQKVRNSLNKAYGFVRGNKKLDAPVVVARLNKAAEQLQQRQYATAEVILNGQSEVAVGTESDVNAAFETFTSAMGALSDDANKINAEVEKIEADLNEHMLWLPNLPHESTLVGTSEEENKPWTPEGAMYEFDFTPKPHWELGPALGIIDFERGVRMAGSRFYVLAGWGARLQRALAAFFLDMAREKRFEELYVPFLVREEMLIGASQFPKFKDVVYHHSEDDEDLYLLPTAEVALTNMHRDEILQESQLPVYYVAQTPCFRREKTSAGRDVRGIKRVHQFEKVEMYKFTTPETSYAELESLVEASSDICRALKLPFRRLEICTGDLGFSATKKYDLEIWAPGCEEWLEVSSCSNCESFQARRAAIRYYPENSKKAQYVHTLNGSGLALPRVIIAILENYQQADGSVIIPEVLRPYLGGVDRITAKDA